MGVHTLFPQGQGSLFMHLAIEYEIIVFFLQFMEIGLL